MDIPVINIGNSKGIRLPRTILEEYNITDTIEMVLEKGRIILKPKPLPRKGWEKAFRQMHLNKHDSLLIDDVFTDETLDEWK